MDPHKPYDVFPVVCCGVDWLTVTSNDKKFGNPLERWAEAEVEKRFVGNGQGSPAKRFGYQGRSFSGLFLGRRHDGFMVQMSGPGCTPLATEAITRSTNVSRIDLQVTVFTEGEQPHLAAWTRARMMERMGVNGRPGRIDLILGHPDGETLSLNHRRCDAFGRLYDKTAEAKLGPPRLLWRYEVEWKGKLARLVAKRLLGDGAGPLCVNSLVHSFWTKKGVQPAFQCLGSEDALQHSIEGSGRDVLAWFRDSMSKCLATAIRQHGAPAVLEALNLTKLVQGGNDNVGSHL